MRTLMRKALARGVLLGVVLGCTLALPAQTTSSPNSSATTTDHLAVPAGEHLVLELEESLHTRRNREGDKAAFTTVNETLVGYQIAIPRGSTVHATLTKVKRAGRGGRGGKIGLRFDEIVLPDGTTLPFEAILLRAGFSSVNQGKQGSTVKGEGGLGGRDAASVAVMAGQGALLGAVIKGGKGAAYGGAIGAGIGLVQILLQKGPELELPRGMLFEVELKNGLNVPRAAALRFAQAVPPAGQPSPPAASSGAFTFPGDAAADEPEEPIPDFDEEKTEETATEEIATEETAEGAVDRESIPPPAAPTAPLPLPPVLDPTLGDPDAYKLTVDVRLVTVEAFVRDHGGRPLEDLKREDFRLFEDGVEQKICHFSRDQLPLAVALVVDQSGSVAPYVRDLRRAAYQTLSQLKPGDQVALFAFASDVDRLEDLTTDRRRIAERIAHIRPAGGTNITDALYAAAYYLSATAPDRRRTIILISDNQETVRGHTGQGRVIRIALESETVIYSIRTPGDNRSSVGIMRLPGWMGGLASVRKIVRETGGEIIDVRAVGSVQAALATVIRRLKTRYTLGYQSTNKARDGAFRTIEVRLTERYGRPGDDYTVFARRGYYAPKETVASQSADTR